MMILCIPALGFAGEIDSPGNPSAGSGMYTLLQLYDYLNFGTAPTVSASFQEPSATPGSTMKTTKSILDDARAKFEQCDAQESDVIFGKKFFSTQETWGVQAGTMVDNGPGTTITPGRSNQALSAGFWSSENTVLGDSDLIPGNIKSGVNIFGVSGSLYCPSPTCTGTAVETDVLSGKSFSNSSSTGLNGSMTNVGQQIITPTNTSRTISPGYHNGTGYVVGDSALNTNNIRAGATIFGVNGNTAVVNTSTGNATVGDILQGAKAWVNGTEIAGVITRRSGDNASTGQTATCGDGQICFTPPSGYYDGYDTVSALWSQVRDLDSDFTEGNIKQNVDIFGLTGTYPLAGVARTGQTTCYDVGGAVEPCSGTGQDGDNLKGIAWPNPRFTDNSNGTVTDNLTGLIWLKNANCFELQAWGSALSYCNALVGDNTQCGLNDGSSIGDWRLPNRFELESLLDMSRSSPALPLDHPFSSVKSSVYWSSTTYAVDTDNAWGVYLLNGFVYSISKIAATSYVWPVRSEQ